MSTRAERKALRPAKSSPLKDLLVIIGKAVINDGFYEIHVDDLSERKIDIEKLKKKLDKLEYEYTHVIGECHHNDECNGRCAPNRYYCNHSHHFDDCKDGEWLRIDDGVVTEDSD